MTEKRISSALALTLLAGCSIVPLQASEQASARRTLSGIDGDLTSGSIGRVEILAIPDPISVEVAMTEKGLAESAFFRCEYRKGEHEFDELTSSILKMRVTGPAEFPDIRWGLIFFDAHDRVVGTIYLEQEYPSLPNISGKIDGHVVTVDKSLINWLVNHIPSKDCIDLRIRPPN